MKVDVQGNIVEWEDMRMTLLEELEGLTYEETLTQWAAWDDYFREFESGSYYGDWLRSMILIDRYFLLTQVLLPDKVKPKAMHPWLFARCREVEANPDGFLDLWAREHWKTSIITHCGSIQEILRNPEITIGIFSHTKGIAKKILMAIKNDLENNQTLKECFPDVLFKNPKKESPAWTLEKFIVKREGNPREATCEAWGVVDGQPTGAHFLLRVYDDLVTAESVATPEQIEKTTEMLALSDNLGADGGRVRFIGTRYSLGDTYQNMIEKGQVRVRVYAATQNGLLEGKPVFFSQEYWDSKKKSQTIQSLSCQMLQNPNAGSQAMFKLDTLSFYLQRPQLLSVYILVDPARAKKKGSDKTAMAVIGVDSNYSKFLLDGVHHRMGLNEKWTTLKKLYNDWNSKPGVMTVKVGYEVYGAQSDTDYFAEQMQKENSFFDIEELNGKASKIDRMSRLEPDIRNGRLFLPAVVMENGSPKQIRMGRDEMGNTRIEKRLLSRDQIQANGAKLTGKYAVSALSRLNEDRKAYDLTLDFISQASQVPNNSAHDDLVDAMSRLYDMEIVVPRIYSKQGLSQPDVNDW